jgi:hypothetical protein
MITAQRICLVAFVLSSFVSPLACKGDSSGGGDKKSDDKKAEKIASCDLIKQESMCREWGDANVQASGESFLKDMCTNSLKGNYAASACPKDKRVGACTTPEGTKVFYNDGPAPLDAATAEKMCKEGVPAGTWKTSG